MKEIAELNNLNPTRQAKAVEVMKEIAEWLNNLNPTHQAKAVEVILGDKKFVGAKYFNSNNGLAYYLLGQVPKWRAPKRGVSSKAVYRFEGSEKDWYVGCYFAGSDKPFIDLKHFHPFGHNFILFSWNLEESIDNFEPLPFQRILCKEIS